MIPTLVIKDWPIDESLNPIELHITGLETFMKCPYKSRFQWPIKNVEALYEWDISEQLLTNYLYWPKLWDEVLKHFGNSKEFPHFNRLKKHAENFKKTLSEDSRKDRYPIFTQKKMKIKVIYAPYIIYLVWTADRIFNDYHMTDCKTSANKWQEKDLDWKLQWRIYPWMLRYTAWSHVHPTLAEDTFSFTYFIFTKQVTPQLQILQPTARYSEVQWLVEYLIIKYMDSVINNKREPRKCLDCKRCDCRTTCPIWKLAGQDEDRF